MKQRLLLALLVLFASVGMVQAANNTVVITPPSNTNTFKVSWTGDAPTFTDAQNTLVEGNTCTITPTASTAVTVTAGTSTTGYVIEGTLTNVEVKDDNLTSLTLSGDVSNLTITNGAKLKTLNLDVSNITGLNAKGISLTSDAFTGSGKPLEFLSKATGTWSFTEWEKLDESNKTYSSTNEEHAIANVTGAFAFYDASNYYTHGTYRCKVTKGSVSTVLTGLKINPAPIKITIEGSDMNGWGNEVMGGIGTSGIVAVDGDCTAGNVSAHASTNASGYLTSYTCHQGDKITVIATPKDDNYVFDKFETNTALVDESHAAGSQTSTFTVKAKCKASDPDTQEDVKLKALFKGKDCKISFNESVLNGSFYITDMSDSNQKLSNNAIVEYGHKLMIQATPNDKYYAEYKVGDADPTGSYNTAKDVFKKDNVAYVFVDQDRTITVNFLTDNVTGAYNIKVQSPSDVTPATGDMKDVVAAIKIGEETAITPTDQKADAELTLSPTKTNAGTSIPISVTVKEDKGYVVKSILIGTKSLDVINDGNNKFTANFIAPEDGNASFTIVVVKQADINVYVDGKALSAPTALELDAAQAYTYDKQGHGLKYTTTPSGLTLKVLYKLSTLSGNEYYTTDLPTTVGKYEVKISREADTYAAIEETVVKVTSTDAPAIEITPATIAITTAPTVTAQKDSKTGKYSFVLSGGVATSLGENVTSKGTFEVLKEVSDESTSTSLDKEVDITDAKKVAEAVSYTDNLVPVSIQDKYINVAVRFKMKNDANYNPAATRVRVLVGKATDTKHDLTINSNIVTVDGAQSDIKAVQSEVYNGATRVAYGNTITKVSLGDGLKVRLRAIVDGYSKVSFINMDPAPASGQDKYEATLVEGTTNTFETADITLNKDFAFKIDLSGKLKQVYKLESFKRVEVTYNGEPQPYNPTSANDQFVIYKNEAAIDNGATTELAKLLKTSPIYYKDETGKVVTGGAPVDAGKYDVCIDIPASTKTDDVYDAQTLTASQALQIVKKKPSVKWPTGVSRIGAGQALSAAQLFTDGTADISGTFAWEDGTIAPKNGQFYTIKFTPDDTKNYETVKLLATTQQNDLAYENLAITVSSKPIVSIDGSVANGSFVVKSGNVEYHSGNEVEDGTTLTVTPVANDGFVCKTLIIDESGTKHTATGATTIKINGKSIYVTGEFELKSAVDPNTQYTVTLPAIDAVKGVIINKPGVNAVKKEASFAFTLSSLAADAANIVVKVDGTTITPVDGTYTIAKVDGNKTISVALANPTKIKVVVEKETRNASKHLMGKVEVEGLAKDSTCYYGDEVTIVAFPESGVTFDGWSGSITGKEKLATFIVKEAMKITPKFSGVPTGIEEIEGIKIYGADGCIFISCDGVAQATIVSMDGRSRTIEVSGETRIQESAGLYGVVLVQGSQVIKKKVIVR